MIVLYQTFASITSDSELAIMCEFGEIKNLQNRSSSITSSSPLPILESLRESTIESYVYENNPLMLKYPAELVNVDNCK